MQLVECDLDEVKHLTESCFFKWREGERRREGGRGDVVEKEELLCSSCLFCREVFVCGLSRILNSF